MADPHRRKRRIHWVAAVVWSGALTLITYNPYEGFILELLQAEWNEDYLGFATELADRMIQDRAWSSPVWYLPD